MSLIQSSPETITYESASTSLIQKQQYQVIRPVVFQNLSKQISEIVISCQEKRQTPESILQVGQQSIIDSSCSKPSTIHSLQDDIQNCSQQVKPSSAMQTSSFSSKAVKPKGLALSDCVESSNSSSDSQTQKGENPKVEYVLQAKTFPQCEYDPETGTDKHRGKFLEDFNSEFQRTDYSYFLQNQERLQKQIIRVASCWEFTRIIYGPCLKKLLSLIQEKIRSVPKSKPTEDHIDQIVGRIERLLGESCTKKQSEKEQKATNFLYNKKEQGVEMDIIN